MELLTFKKHFMMRSSRLRSAPLQRLLWACGVDVEGGRPLIALGVAFHAVWAATFGVVACCFYRYRSSFSLLMMVTASLTLANWWALWWRRRRLRRVLRPGAASQRLAWAALTLIAALVIVPAVTVAVMLSREGSDNAARCNECLFHVPPELRGVHTFVVQAARQVVNCGFNLTVAMLYCMLCLQEHGRATRVLRRSKEAPRSSYLELRGRMRGLERALSPSVFLVFLACFCEAFRGLMQILFAWPRHPHLLVLAAFYMAAALAAFLAPLAAADALGAVMGRLRAALAQGLPLWLEPAPLTAWGMFEVRRGLLLTALASLITYGVIVGQMTGG